MINSSSISIFATQSALPHYEKTFLCTSVLDLLYSADAKLREDTAKALVNTGALQRIQTNLEHDTEEEQIELEKEETRLAA